MYNQFKNIKYLSIVSLIQMGNCKKIGFFGGSFNPPHAGHLYIANQALKSLNLDIIFWLITPQNPNKHTQDTISIDQRTKLAEQLCKNNYQIKIINLEESFYFHYTFLTLQFIKKITHPSTQIFWIMGEDNLYNFHLFKKWQYIMELVPMAIFARNKKSFMTLCQKSSIIYKNMLNDKIKFFLIPTNSLSSTQIRTKGQT